MFYDLVVYIAGILVRRERADFGMDWCGGGLVRPGFSPVGFVEPLLTVGGGA